METTPSRDVVGSNWWPPAADLSTSKHTFNNTFNTNPNRTMNTVDFDKIQKQMDRRMNAMLNPDSKDAKALREEEKKARKKMKRQFILGTAGGGCLYVFLVLFVVALNLGVLAAGVYIVVWILRAMGVL